ncbi:PP2C family protein-serine/threonine phosphatase [Salinibius halmophilus]|uniref:PP2C family protein-serine/threonine phosphatase n=1 Tax=Salinibius halmophilus TaxID=1853216 RepID=UPI000E66E31F|nr:SpoIIE family protein phosphatase [Salinibius halmophilus]
MERLLVVDDDDAVRHSLSAFLDDCGYHVMHVPSVRQALNVVEQSSVDLIITDLRMPGEDGLDLIRTLQNSCSSIPSIVVSGAGEMPDVVAALRLGAQDYFIKPLVDLELFEHSIRRVLERTKLVQDNAKYREELEETNKRLRHHIEILQSDLEAGRNVQQRMLPAEPLQVDGYKFQHTIHPSSYLSGDFVDYFLISPNVACALIADVSGHGVSSALATVLIKNEVMRLRTRWRTGQSQTVLNPSLVVAHINKELKGSNLDKHATMCWMMIDFEAQQISYANAAHYPFPLVRVDDNVRALEPDGLALGILPEGNWQTHHLSWRSGFSVFACSDGLFEVLPGDKLEQKEQQLRDMIETNQYDIRQYADGFDFSEEAELPDDITMLMINRQD